MSSKSSAPGTFTLPDVEGANSATLEGRKSFFEPLPKGCGNNYSHCGSQYIVRVYQISYMIPRKCLGSEEEKEHLVMSDNRTW